MTTDKERIAEPVVWRRKENMGEYVVYVYYATNCWPDLEPLYLHPSNRIAELEQFINLIAPLGVIECTYCKKPTPIVEEGLDHICPECEIEGMKRKLAEQQAQIAMLRSWFKKDNSCTCETCWSCAGKGAAVLSETANAEELNNLLAKAEEKVHAHYAAQEWDRCGEIAKAKEEGRREAVQFTSIENALPKEIITNGSVNCVLAVWKKEMLDGCIPNPNICNVTYFNSHVHEFTHWMYVPAAPKPQGETNGIIK